MSSRPTASSHSTSLVPGSVWLLVLTLLLAAPGVRGEEPGAGALLLTGARVLNAEGDGYLQGRAVLLQDGRVTDLFGPDKRLPPEAQRAERFDLAGLTLVPGLIDLHSHLLLHPYDEASWDDQVLREQLELRTIRGVVAARTTLEAGFTTLRELGTEGAAYADVALRDAIDQGLVPGPRIFAATRAIVVSGAYGPAGFDPRWTLPKGAQVADGPTGVRRATREQIAAGADWIKVYADYRRRRGGPATATVSREEMAAIVDEATSAGIPVAAHASTDEAIRRAVEAGVRTIEHGYQASSEVLALMRERGVVLCPTLAASDAISRYQGWDPATEADPPRVRAARELMRRALDAGVTIALGSDVGVFAHGDNVRELELLVDYGMTPEGALRAATSTAAEVLGRERDLGRIDAGYLADLVAVAGDPLADVSALRSPAVVFKEGVLVIDRR